MNLNIVLAATLFQALATWSALLFAEMPAIFLCIVIGGGLVPALIYPLLMMIVMTDLEKENAHARKFLMFVLALIADLGQLMGGVLLITPHLFHINLGVMILPVAVCIVIVLFVNVKLSLKNQGG